MKFFVYLIFLFLGIVNAQGNLEYNQSRIVQIPVGPTGVTVPLGKVWKVQALKNSGESRKAVIAVDGESFPISPNSVFWIEGGSVITRAGGSLSSGTTEAQAMNVIEFNVSSSSSSGNTGPGLSSEGLRFNRIVNLYLTGSVGRIGTGPNVNPHLNTTITIPQGKVWKITSVAMNRRSTDVLSDFTGLAARLGDQIIYGRYTSGYAPESLAYPVWMNSGSKDLSISYTGSGGIGYAISISAIEYDVPN